MIGDALEYPRRDDSWLKTVGIGGILFLAGSLILLPLIPLEGYFKRVLAGTARGERDPPKFEDWVELTVDGLWMYLIQIAYVLVPMVLFVIGLISLGAAGVTGARTGGLGVVFTVAGGLLGVFVAYIVPVALTNFAYQDDLSAAFDFRTIVSAAFTMEYFLAVLAAIVVAIVLGVIGSLLMIVLIGIFVLFYVQVMVYFILATGVARGMGLGSQASTAA